MSADPSVAEFYDILASDYDAMTGFSRRITQEEPVFRDLVRRYQVSKALDAGCGTGFHSVLLSRLGVQVTGVDVSPGMLEKARHNALEFGARAQFIQSDFRHLPSKVSSLFDGVFCLGNSLAHILALEEVVQSLAALSSLLEEDGTLFIQILNYDRILSRRERIQSVKEAGDSIFIRFYDLAPEHLQFNLLRLQHRSGILEHRLSSIRLRPLRVADLSGLLTTCGLTDISVFSNAQLARFDAENSTDVFLVARKQGPE